MSDLRKAIEEPPAGMQCKDIADVPLLATIARKEAESGSWVTIWGFDGTPYGELPEKLLRAKMGKLIRRGLITGCICGCRGDFQMTDKGRDYIEWDAALTRLGESSVESKNHRVEAAAKAIGEQIAETSDELEADGRWEEARRLEAKAALAAADTVMFSEEAMERAAKALLDRHATGTNWDDQSPLMRGMYLLDVRAVVAALRGEA